MLGNFSFADYFKEEAVRWAFELVTEVYGIDPDRLWVTVFEDDDVTPKAWLDIARLAPERIVARGAVDAEGEPANYWWTHAAGPAGPCSEIFVDRGAAYGPDGGPDVDEERFMEIWNLVFMQEVVASEEERFAATLRQGMVLFEDARTQAVDGVVRGDDAFKLSDTFGFPVELTMELAADAGLSVDEDRFRELLQEQRDRARAAAKKVAVGLDTGAVPPTTFVGYEQTE